MASANVPCSSNTSDSNCLLSVHVMRWSLGNIMGTRFMFSHATKHHYHLINTLFQKLEDKRM